MLDILPRVLMMDQTSLVNPRAIGIARLNFHEKMGHSLARHDDRARRCPCHRDLVVWAPRGQRTRHNPRDRRPGVPRGVSKRAQWMTLLTAPATEWSVPVTTAMCVPRLMGWSMVVLACHWFFNLVPCRLSNDGTRMWYLWRRSSAVVDPHG